MVSVDLYRGWFDDTPARRSPDFPAPRQDDGRGYIAEVNKSRSPDLYGLSIRHRARAQTTTFKADPNFVAGVLSGLFRGRLEGLNLADNQFADVMQGFLTTIQELGLVVNPPSITSPAASVSANRADTRRRLFAGGLGITNAEVRPSTPRSTFKCDEFMAFVVGEPDLQAALDAGVSDGIPLGLMEATSALLGALVAASRVGDTAAMRRIGEDFGALSAALHEATTGATAQRATGYVTRRKNNGPHGRVTHVRVGGEDVPTKDITTKGGVVRRRTRGVKFTKIT